MKETNETNLEVVENIFPRRGRVDDSWTDLTFQVMSPCLLLPLLCHWSHRVVHSVTYRVYSPYWVMTSSPG